MIYDALDVFNWILEAEWISLAPQVVRNISNSRVSHDESVDLSRALTQLKHHQSLLQFRSLLKWRKSQLLAFVVFQFSPKRNSLEK